MQGDAGAAAPRAALQRSGSADGMDRDSSRTFRTLGLAACVGAAVLCMSAFAAQKVAAADFFEAYDAFQRGEYDEARAIWSTLAHEGDVDAQFNLGALYENGLGVEADAERAARWYRAAALRRVDLARLALARLQRTGALEPEPDEDQIKLLETAARRGLAEAQYELGVAYDHGLGVTQNHATAAGWYQRAAEQGLTDAQYNLATLYDEGLGTPRDIDLAREWYIRAADAGEARAMNNLGYIHEKGLLGVRDYDKAVVWYRRAAREGLAIAQSNLAALHYLGRGVARDFEQAHRWYEAAAAQGDALGQNGLGLLYANGLGVERDLIQAMAWFNLAAHAEGPAGKDAMNYRDRLDRLMSPQERVKADSLSAEILARADAEEVPGKPAFGVALPRPANGFRDSAIYAQRLLKSLGYYDAAVDGVAGEFTIKAARKFLKENRLRMAPQITRDLVEALEEVRKDRIAEAAAAAAAAEEEAARQENVDEPADELVEHNGQGQS
ncbi:MAG: SEL1-like repeat protein [Rhodospirillaceae bacterium]|nr:SEL1-like repeat protein [Rhodospirillaceae bacterium]